MGLASALTTSVTGLAAAETQIDVIGNNLANSQTVGFKASEAIFATQYLQTYSLGSAPNDDSGGTNPRQTGLGTQVAEIAPNFSQGSIEISANPLDLAIQGEGFFILENSAGETVYSRNGIFNTNAENGLVSITGNRLLGFGVDELFQIQTTELVPLTVPLGSAIVAQTTQNVSLEGALGPSGDIADTAEVVGSTVLGDASIPRADGSSVDVDSAPVPDTTGMGVAHLQGAGGLHPEGVTYGYRFAFVDNTGTESPPSAELTVTVPAGDTFANNSIQLTSLPNSTEYSRVNIYRTAAGGSDFFLLGTAAAGAASYADHNTVALSTPLDDSNLSGNYSYLVTYYVPGEEESRPSELLGPQTVVNGRVQIDNLPTPPAGGPPYTQVRLYRNLAADANSYYLVSTLSPSDTFTDNRSDAEISDLTVPGNKMADLDGPKATGSTLLTDVLTRDGLAFEQIFGEGTLSFEGRKGGRGLSANEMEVTSATTVQDMLDLMEEGLGIQTAADDPQNPIPSSVNNIPGESTALAPGTSITEGNIRVVSNNGVDNAISVGLSAYQLTDADGNVLTPNLGFGALQTAAGQSAVTDFVVYDSLGTQLNVRVTAVLESRSGTGTVYRWFAESPDNDPINGADTAVGTGLITFDGEGNIVTVSNDTVSIDRRNVPAASPLEFDMDFTNVSGLDVETSSLAATYQDGSAPGTLTGFTFGEDGIIRGAFTNGISRNLGQVQMARFSNPGGLEQRGQNVLAVGPNSGLPVEGNPGENGIGSIVAGAVELSNTDIGASLIDLVLATAQYRGNTRVITAAQQLLDELLNLRR